MSDRIITRLYNRLLEVTKARDVMASRLARLEEIDDITGSVTIEGGVRALLDTLLPRLAEAIGAVAIVVDLAGPSPQRVVGRPERSSCGDDPGAPGAECTEPLRLAGRSLGSLTALYPMRGGPPDDAGALVRIVAHRVALAVANARLYEGERRLRHELEERDRHKDDFLAVLAHELRAPLAPILSAVELIGRPESDAGLVRRARDVVGRQVRYQAALLDDLLDLTRIAHDRMELRRETVDLRSVTAAALEVTRPSIEERRHALALSDAEEPLMVAADPVRLEQIVINLVTNATKYTPPGGAISVALERRGDTAILSVRDSGDGIAPEALDRVFDPFFRATLPGRRAGSAGLGIGLALSKRLVMLHGGTIEARSAGRGHGSEFIVRLPLVAERDEPRPAAPADHTASPPVPARIVVVDDDADTRQMLALGLELVGHHVTLAGDGRSALQQAANVRPDVMLVDVGLPDVDGYEVARQVRAALGAAVFLVALTGYGSAEDVRAAQAAGFDAHVLKPATFEDLARVLAQRRGTVRAA